MFVEYEKLSPGSRVWVYQSNRPLSPAEQAAWQPRIRAFVEQWTSHSQTVHAWGGILYDCFLVLMTDAGSSPSGCSIDASVAFVRQMGEELGVDWFDRWNFAYKQGDVVHTAHRDEFAALYRQGAIDDQTPVFDNLVQNKADWQSRWLLPLGASWHKNMVG